MRPIIVCVFLISDIVFFIYLYQRWIYRVDPKRVNEYGTSGEDHKVPPVQGGEDVSMLSLPEAVGSPNLGDDSHDNVEKTSEEKKKD